MTDDSRIRCTSLAAARCPQATSNMLHLFARRAAHVILVFSCIVASREAAAQSQAARVFAGAQAASWIAPPGMLGDSSVVFHVRRTFDLGAKPERFVVHVS